LFPARHARPLAFVLAALLAVPTLTSPLLEDDVGHRVMLGGLLPGLTWGPLDLYDFIGGPGRPVTTLRDQGVVPWFAADDLKLRFFRPLSSGLLAADVRLFGEHSWASRLHSLAWFLGCLLGAAVVHRRFLPDPTAGLATVIYAVSVGHLLPVSWIAARYAVISTAFSLLAFWLHLRGRADGSTTAGRLAPLAFALGLLAGEVALGAVALVAAWELVGSRDPIERRLRALAPFAAVTAGYGVWYVAGDFGVRGSGAYVGLDRGLEGLLSVVRHFVILLGELAAATPSDAVGAATSSAQTIAALWGGLVIVIVWVLFRLSRAELDERQLAAVRWMTVAAAGAAAPGSLGIPGGRVLTLALVPASGAVATLLLAGLAAVRRGRLSRPARLFVVTALAGLSVGHLVAAPVLRGLLGVVLTRLAVEQHEQAARVPACDGVMVIAAAADPVIATYVPATMVFRNRGPERFRVLSLAPADHRIDNVTRTGFDLVTLDPGRTRGLWERLYRSGPLPAGTRVAMSHLDARVIEDQLGVPVRVRFDFGEPLDSARLCFREWRDGAVRPFAPPKPGETRDLPHQPGPMGW
jgi:hypothetical protein